MEGSTPSETEKETARRGGTGNIEAPASQARVNEDRMNVKSDCDTTLDHGIIRDEQSYEGSRGCNGQRIVAARSSQTKRRRCKNSLQGKGTGMHR
jgi:hypothetical protein